MGSSVLSRRTILQLAGGAAALPLAPGLLGGSAQAAAAGTLTIAYNVNLPSFDPTVGASAVNPTLTTVANALRVGDHLIALCTGQVSFDPVWTPDGSHIAFYSRTGKNVSIGWVRSDGAGGVQTLIPVDTCHDLMISEPRLLAEILIERCDASQTTCVT